MARGIYRLTAKKVGASNRPGLLSDGGGLYLQISRWKTKAWVFRFMLGGKARKMGLGSLADVTLAEARELAASNRRLVRDGTDPIKFRVLGRAKNRLRDANAKTFRSCAEEYIKAHQAGWRHPKHAAQWGSTMGTYVYPVFGDLPAEEINPELVKRVLEPIWRNKTETASRVRGRIEAVLDWAKANGYRDGENPARWRGHLEHSLPKRSKVQKVKHFAALPYKDLGAFMAKLRKMDGVAPQALEFQILTVARPGMVTAARWAEIDLDEALWVVPAERMKAGREHRIPLSPRAIEIIEAVRPLRRKDDLVFPGQGDGEPLSDAATRAVLGRMGRADLTAHGFRSTFSDWCAERTAIPSELREMALAHAVGDKVEAAYRRGDLFEKRAQVMGTWADYAAKIEKASDRKNVIQLRMI